MDYVTTPSSLQFFTHLKVTINHHSYSFLITCEKFWLFSVWSRAYVDQLNDAHVQAHALAPFVSCHSCTRTESVSVLASLAEQKRQRLTQERETVRLLRSSNIRKEKKILKFNKNQTLGKDTPGPEAIFKGGICHVWRAHHS